MCNSPSSVVQKIRRRELADPAYFNGEVEKPKYFEIWTPYKKVLGMARPVVNRSTGKVSSALHISRRYNWTEQNLKHVVVHEMIHLYIGDYKRPLTFIQRLPLIGRIFIAGHDKEFITMMKKLNAAYGLDIKVRFKEMKAELKG